MYSLLWVAVKNAQNPLDLMVSKIPSDFFFLLSANIYGTYQVSVAPLFLIFHIPEKDGAVNNNIEMLKFSV